MKIEINDAKRLCEWYNTNKRSLPWRDTGNPYDVWLSEIMLQQTRIEAVKEKFILIRKELPDIQSLAEVDEDRLMRLWEGLGYYSRARNLKKCAITLINQYDGKLPDDYDALLGLPGIGPYTAGAIASIAYGLPHSAVDGNVCRVLARVFEVKEDIRNTSVKNMFENIIERMFTECSDPAFISSFNQGIMELGETVCVPNGTPDCAHCPFVSICRAHLHNTWNTIPYRSKNKDRRIVNRTLFIIRNQEYFLIHKRDDSGLLKGMYEFTGVDGHLSRKEAIAFVQQLGYEPVTIHPLPSSRHIFTHLEWHMKAYEIMIGDHENSVPEGYCFVTKKELSSLAIPSAFRTYTAYYEIR